MEERGEDKRKVKLFKYIGESAKSAFERGFEHQNDRRTLSTKSHMLKHAIDQHEGTDPEKVEFRMRIVKFHRKAFKRQVSESVEIRRNAKHNILNSKGEYNRCALPRLGLKMGTKEYSAAKADEEKAEEQEKNIEEKLKIMRKLAGKRTQRRKGQENPAPKRRKTGEDNEYIELKIASFPKITENAGEKRKDRENEEIMALPPKAKRRKQFQKDIRLYAVKTELGTAQAPELHTESGTAPETACGTAQVHKLTNKEAGAGERDNTAHETELGTVQAPELDTEGGTAPETECGTAQVHETGNKESGPGE